jgi:hypothetical protein
MALSAAWAALYGITAWQKQLRGRTEYEDEVARRVLAGVYRVRNALTTVRSPAIFSSEYVGRPNRPKDARHSDGNDLAYVYQQRFAPVEETYANLQVDLLEAEALWADEIRKCAMALHSCISCLAIAVSSYVDMKNDAARALSGKMESNRESQREVVVIQTDRWVKEASDG